MKLDAKEFKRFKALQAAAKEGKISAAEKAELEALTAKKNERGSNDISWWKNYPELLKDAINLPFNWIPGTRVDVTGYQGTSDTLKLGVMAKAIVRPGIGLSTSGADAFNSQIRQLWLDMHKRYRGIGAYQQSDLGITILAIQSLFETLAKFERMYGVINSYKIGNRVVPYGLKEMLQISNDLEDNLADFRYTLNLYTAKLKQLCLPRGLGVMESDLIAIGNLFKDSEDRRAFIFCFDTDTFGVYNPTIVNTGGTAIGGAVTYSKFSPTGVTTGTRPGFLLSDIRNVLETQTNALLSDDDVSKICSDILAAYGPENAMTLTPVPDDFVIEPVHDYERLVQFHNLTVVGPVASIYDDAVVDTTLADSLLVTNQIPIMFYQYNDNVMCRLGVTDDASAYINVSGLNYPRRDTTVVVGAPKEGEVIFDTWAENPGEVELMCGSRYTTLCAAPTIVATNIIRQSLTAFGSKVVIDLVVYGAVSSGQYIDSHLQESVVDNTQFRNNYSSYMRIMQMDWHPLFYISSADVEIFGDVDNFTRIDISNLRRIHEVALLSGYKIPAVSKAD